MTEEASAFIVSARAGIGLVRSAGFQTCRIADFQVGRAWNSTAGLILTAIRRFGNPRYSRFGNLRYGFCTSKSRGRPIRGVVGRSEPTCPLAGEDAFFSFAHAAARSKAVIVDGGKKKVH